MDKYELSIKEDKIRKHAEKKDYVTAAKIADTIDWGRVKNIKMLTLVSQIYEKTQNYAEAKNVLLLAYERVPVGRRMLYKLTELCIKAGNLDEAEEFFEEFQEIAPNDISKLILAYQIESAKGAPIDKLITILELYRKNEFEEKWAYELAYLYHKAGRVKECVQLCNEIILWFSVGPYVDKALNLKMQYEPLTPSQQEKLVNKKKFEERIKAVEREFEEKYSQEAFEEPTLEEKGLKEAAATEDPEAVEEAETEEAVIEDPDLNSGITMPDPALDELEAGLAQSVREAGPEPLDEIESEALVEPTREFVSEDAMAVTEELPVIKPEPAKAEGPAAPVAEEEKAEEPAAPAAEEEKAEESAAPAIEEEKTEEPAAPELGNTSDLVSQVSAALAASVSEEMAEEAPSQEEAQGEAEELFEEEPLQDFRITCVVVEEPEEAKRIPAAVESLKKTHEILGLPASQAAKISAGKLNAKGFRGVFAKLSGRDLIIDRAGDLDDRTVEELVELLQNPTASMVMILADTPERVEDLLVSHEALDALCVYLEDDSQMTIDEFIEAAENYAREEECVIDEVARMAMYAAAERMRNNGEAFSEEAARELIDDAIEKAEHRGFKGLFSSKYNKEGYLILKEQFFS